MPPHWSETLRLAGTAVTRAGHSFINPALARMGLRGGVGNGAGNRDCFVGMELAWRVCVHGWSWGKRIAGFVVESSWSAAACTARGTAQPTRGCQQHPEPLPGVSTSQPLLSSSQSRPGKGSPRGMVGKPPYASTQDNPQRLQALLAARLLESPPQSLSFPSYRMERVMLSP